MRFRLSIAALALLLAAPTIGHAQSADAGVDLSGGFTNPAALQTLLLLQLYGLQQQQMDSLPPAERDEIAKRVAEYFTNGAEATGVPTSGPGAAYFQNGAEVTAAQTAEAIPFGASASASPDLGPDAEASAAPAASGSAQGVAAPTAPLAPPTASPASEESASSASAESAPGEPSVPPPSLTPPESSIASPLPGSPAARAALSVASAVGGGPSRMRGNAWYSPWLGGIGMAAFVVFLGMRVRSRRRPTTGSL